MKERCSNRVIKDFMIQAGDPDSKNAPKGKMLGAGDVGYTLPAEFVYRSIFTKKALCRLPVKETMSIRRKNHPVASSTL